MEIFKVTYLERFFLVNGEIKKYSYPVRSKNPMGIKKLYPEIGYRFYDSVFEINEETDRVEVSHRYTPTVYYGVRNQCGPSLDNDVNNDICVTYEGKEIDMHTGDMTYDELVETQLKLKMSKKRVNDGN